MEKITGKGFSQKTIQRLHHNYFICLLNKKSVLLILFIFINLQFSNIHAFEFKYDSTNLELSGGYAGVAMTKWNNVIDNSTNEAAAMGFRSVFNHINNSFIFSSVIDNGFNSSIGKINLYFKYEYLSILTKEDIEYWPNGVLFYNSTNEIRPSYFGLGGKHQIINFSTVYPKFYLTVGADFGIFFTYGFQRGNKYLSDGSLYYEYEKKFEIDKSIFVGGNVELGLNLWFNDRLGIFINGGYRIADGSLHTNMVSCTDLTQIGTKEWWNMDYSGLFVKIGLLIGII